jgi:hypothetical protein
MISRIVKTGALLVIPVVAAILSSCSEVKKGAPLMPVPDQVTAAEWQVINQKLFIAVTAPLRTVQSGPKAWLKGLMGSTPGGYIDNYRRQEFSTLLRGRYDRQGRLFDLAKFEAEGSGSHQYQVQPLEVLNPAFSDDGGHFNAQGQLHVATRVLKFIAALPSRP